MQAFATLGKKKTQADTSATSTTPRLRTDPSDPPLPCAYLGLALELLLDVLDQHKRLLRVDHLVEDERLDRKVNAVTAASGDNNRRRKQETERGEGEQ